MVISFSLLLSLAQPRPARAAAVKGEVELANSKDGAARRRKDYSGVVIWLEPVDRPAPALVPKREKMIQRDKRFIPHVVAISVGSSVDFPNDDLVYHNAFSNFSGQAFDLGLYPPGTSKPILLKRPGIVRVFCNIHPTMSAIIAVVDTPWFAVTEATGRFSIANVPPGRYNLHIYHERALEDNLHFLEHEVTVPEGGLTLPLISVTETGFIPAPHPNKYGKEYPPAPNSASYPGAPK
ncbi:MAG: hypothetical protein LAP87_20215 [Acidobacteriia bacterium]|nr:hypothetical protein [Terriglobia bacterium]